MKVFRQLLCAVLSMACAGCGNDGISPPNEPAEGFSQIIDKIDEQLIQGREAPLQGNPCFETYLKPNLEDTVSLLELHREDFISRTPFLLEATLHVASGRPDELLLMFYWLCKVENLGGIRVIEFWDNEEEGIGVIDERYQIFSGDHDREFYGSVPFLWWGLWVQPRETFSVRKDDAKWADMHMHAHEDWLTDVPEIFMSDPREGVQVFISIFDVKGRESRWFPVKCVFTEEDVN